MNITMDLAQFKAGLEKEKARIQAATRPAAQAGAQVIYDAARANTPVSKRAHFFYGTHQKYGPYRPGNLRDSIYQVYSEDNSSNTRATYHISWNRLKAPYAWMVEFGTSRAPARSFIGKAVAEQSATAATAMKRTFIERVRQS